LIQLALQQLQKILQQLQKYGKDAAISNTAEVTGVD
jgi:hypothetical protein